MRDLSLHILDVLENSLRAGAAVISVTMAMDPEKGLFTITIEDDGPGLDVPPDVATDPFYTTKRGKRVGLGLALLRGAAERAGGDLRIGRSQLGGASVSATMQYGHVDRSPIGDVAATMTSVVATHPAVDFLFRLRVGRGEWSVRSSEVVAGLTEGRRDSLTVARDFGKNVKKVLKNLTPA